MFGDELLPAVTVRQALRLDGIHSQQGHGKIPDRPFILDEPAPTMRKGVPGCSDVLIESGSKCRRDTKGQPRGPLVKTLDNPSFAVDRTPPSLSLHRRRGLFLTDRDKPCPTISAGGHETGGSEPIHNRKRSGFIRRLTPYECARLQSCPGDFIWPDIATKPAPDDFVWPDGITKTAMYSVIGNGWSCAHSHAFSLAFALTDPESHTVVDLFCGGGLAAVGWHGRFWRYEA